METDNNEPTIEDIKKIADNRRPKKYTKEDIIKNLELAREKRKQKLQQAVTLNNKKEEVLEDGDTDGDVNEREPEIPIVLNKKPTIIKHKSQYNNLNSLSDLYESINNIKELISSQSKVIEDAIKPKPKQKKQRKPKVETKTLDLSISDKEVENIIIGNDNNIKKETDAKLKLFLDALKKITFIFIYISITTLPPWNIA